MFSTVSFASTSLLIIMVLTGIESPTAQPSAIDSLETAMKQSSGTARVDLLNQLSALFAEQKDDKGFQYARQADELAKSLGYHKGYAEARSSIGYAHFQAGEYREAVDCFLNTLKILGEDGDPAVVGRCCDRLGNVYIQMDRNRDALVLFDKAVSLLRQGKDRAELAGTLNSYGIAYWRISEYDSALVRLEEAMQIREAMNDTVNVARIHNNMGVMLYRRGISKRLWNTTWNRCVCARKSATVKASRWFSGISEKHTKIWGGSTMRCRISCIRSE